MAASLSSDDSFDFDSDNEEKKAAKLESPSCAETTPIKPEYSEEDLCKLVRYVKRITTLCDLAEEDWNDECTEVIERFFLEPNNVVLTVYFDGDILKCMLGFPTIPVNDLTYFYREQPNDLFTPENFHELINFGTVDNSIEGSILKIMENVFSPMFFTNTTWPDSVKSDFCTHLHSFLANLTEMHYKMLGLTVIYIPKEGLDLPVEVAIRDKELTKRLEGVAVHWTRQVKIAIGDQDQVSPQELLCPTDEYDFWVYRFENLSGLNYQLQDKSLKHLTDILRAINSTYIEQFITLAEEISESMKEAKSNIEYLQILNKPCNVLKKITDPLRIPDYISHILNLFRFIWTKSPYYNSPEKITALCRALSNQIILQCTVYVNMDTVFEGKTRASIQMFNNCIDCCLKYKKIYSLIAKFHSERDEGEWDLDNSAIFNHVDSFMTRCKDMIEICNAMIVFGRFDETEEIPKPRFSSSRGIELEKLAEEIEEMFKQCLKKIELVKHTVMDVQASSWHEEILKFRVSVQELEIIIENMVTSVFDSIVTIADGVETLAFLFIYYRRENLKPALDKRVTEIYRMFGERIEGVKKEVVEDKDKYPAMLPYYAGRALMAKLKKIRLSNLKERLDDAQWMPTCSIAQDVLQRYEKITSHIDERIAALHNEWLDSLDEKLVQRLNRPLMCRSHTHPGLLECNIDRTLLEVLDEAQYWSALEMNLPYYVLNVAKKQSSIKLVYENVLTVVLDYNQILSSLSDEERVLFKQLILIAEKKIAPGLSKLTWASDVSDEYIAECCAYTADLQVFLDDYKNCNLEIVRICEVICDTSVIDITSNYAYELNELQVHIDEHRNETVKMIASLYNDIIKYLIVVYEGFEANIDNMAEAWVKYIKRFDAVLEEALRLCVKGSLEIMYETVHGDGTTGPSPFLKLEANLKKNQINFSPSVTKVGSLIANILPDIISTIKVIPRLFEKFQLAGVGPLPFYAVLQKDEDCKKLQFLLCQEVTHNVTQIQQYKKVWDPFVEIWQVDKDRFIKRYEMQKPSAAAFDANIGRYTEVANNASIQETVTDVHFLVVNSDELKKAIIEHCLEWQTRLSELLCRIARGKVDHVYTYTEENSIKAMHEPQNLDEMQESILLFERLTEEIEIEEKEFPVIEEQFHVLEKYQVEIDEEMHHRNNNIPEVWKRYLLLLEEAEIMLNQSKDVFKAGLLNAAEVFKNDAAALLDNFLANAPTLADIPATDALAQLSVFRGHLNEMRRREAQLKKDLGVFHISHPDSPILQKFEKDLIALELVWELTDQWDKAWYKYKSGVFWNIETGEMEETAQTLFRKLTRLSRELKEKNWQIVESTRARVDAFRRTLPLLVDLKNPAMRERHWDRVKTAMDRDFDQNSPDFKLEAIMEMEMQNFADQISEISNAATMELQIESGLKAIQDVWKAMTVEIVPHKTEGIYRLKSVDECFQVLEENMVSLSTMKSTRYVEPFAKEVDYWERSLSYIMETLELMLGVQRQYLYLENIFFGEDIRKQLPKESADYDKLTHDWSEITTKMYKMPTAFKATHYRPPPYLYNKFNSMNEEMDLIQRALERYLETKRHIFPRFYFISNDALLEILGNSKKPELIQPHLKKLFDNVNKLRMGKQISSGRTVGEALISEDGELVEFAKPLVLDGQCEYYLRDLERVMRVTLRDLLRQCRQALRKMLTKRDKWLLMWQGQLTIVSSKIQWTSDCTRTLLQCKFLEAKKPMKKMRRKQNQVLAKLSELSRKDLLKIQRLKANALITIEIHSRDCIDRMYKAACMDVNSFEWFSQLRYYWDRELDDCIIRQTNTHNTYGHEYTGNSGRLVVTPLTERCYITLTTALHLNRGGSPKGPAGTGKTETVKDLSRALGIWAIVINCSEGLDYKSMGKTYSGLAQSGCWGCFDEFNRINIEVLSVVAQQILSILQAMSQRLTKFVFEGSEINLVFTCGVFITMNPGYAGRTELPDNLKSMFRPISMMVPDNVIIADNILFSDGFQSSKILAKKVYTLYDLAKKQLSKQDHYDFGLRSMVALLRYAGRKRRAHPHLPEEQMVYLAMRDMNIAKLTANDLPLFNGIMSDIFPGVEVPVIDYEDMNTAITADLKLHGLQPISTAIVKVIQLYETKSSRHSVMILGNTGTAKSVTWKTLKRAMSNLKKAGKNDYQIVTEYPVNPKAVSLGELYGEYNLATGEWLDGVLSAIMRKTCGDESPEEKWILFDGPVDAVWIENMNSVMDDNKVLTLINSERITMPSQVSLLFEVGDLSVASPATVSRCGMVYNDYKDWGWKPFVDSWLQKQPVPEYRDEMRGYFDRYIASILTFKRIHCVETIPTCEFNVMKSLCRLLECFATKENGLDPADQEVFQSLSKMWFLFCVIWSVCSTVDEEGRVKLDNRIREMEGIFPLKDTIYEYFVDVRSRSLMAWEEKLSESWKFNPALPFYKIIVPTVDTVRYEYIVSALLQRGYPAVLTGPVGTGKTSTAFSVLGNFDPNKFTILLLNMSAQTTSNNVQDTIESRLEKRTKGVYTPVGGKKLISFLDDLNMPAKDTYGSQPPLELLRQWIDYGFWYDREKQTIKNVKDMQLMAAMGPPGGGRTLISDRLLSRFNVINMTFPSKPTIDRIFGSLLSQQLLDFDDEVKVIGKTLTEATIDLYNIVIVKMLPTPAKMHYLFNLRDISKIFQGLLRSNKDFQSTKQAFLRLWVHECFRVFYDRLIDEKDRDWFVSQINEQLGKYFDLTFHALCPSKHCPIFGHFVNPYYIYEELADLAALRRYIELQMDEYNVSPGVVRLDIVLFKDAIVHICRIVRVISQPRGNMLLVGVGGSGRQSLSRISAYMCEYITFQVEVTKNYRVPEFKEDLKLLYKMTGVERKASTFLFNDTQVTDESFLEIVNNMLSSGEVANLYKPDEFEEIKNSLQDAAAKANIMPTSEALYAFLIERVRGNLHVVLCMSPIGDAFRNRLRQYPALINCTTIDWFLEWPKNALLEVASKYLAEVNFVATITGEVLVKRKDSVLVSTQDRLKEAVAIIFADVHSSVCECSRRMEAEMKRHNYVTPTNYLELVAGYIRMLDQKRNEKALAANKLRNGLSKIDETQAKVEIMSIELAEAQIKINEFQLECDEVMVVITNQTKEADEQKKSVAIRSVKIGEEEVACKKLASQAEADLAVAMPALEAAITALDSLNKKDITEVRSYGRPPQKVEMVMEAVMIMKQVEPTWAEAKRQLGDNNFLDNLRKFDKDNIPDKVLKKIATYTSNSEFKPDKVGIVSLAAKSLCMWCIAIEKYAKVYRYVAPKKAKYDEAMASLQEKQAMLAEAQRALRELNEMLAKLEADYQEKLRQKEELNKKAEILRLQLERAAILVDGLSGEKTRWEQTVETLDSEFSLLPGDCLVATAFISYLGPFVSQYRDALVDGWRKQVIELEVPCSPKFDISNFLSDPTSIREWNIQGLPSDAFSTENGIIVVRGTRWPLVIDPQCQAMKWIKNMESKRGLIVIDFGMADYMKYLEQAVRLGKSVLLQNVMEVLDPSLGPILTKAVVRQGNRLIMKLNDKEIEYNENFRFFITTKLSNPHYAPEVSTKTTLVNFAVKETGLEAQLLGIVVRKEKPQLEEQKDNLVMTIATGKRTLIELEDELLRLLYESSGSLLDDVNLITTLQTSKSTSISVKESLKVSTTTEVEIDSAREGYRPSAKRASILFFVLNDMGRIDPMYQFSLDSYIFLFIQSIEKSPRSAELVDRIQFLNEYHTYAVYKNTCRGLFERHKLLFSFHMCMKILEATGKVSAVEYGFLLKGGVVLDRENQMDNPCTNWLTDSAWDNVTELDKLPGFHGIVDSFEQYPRDWHMWYTDTEPEVQPLIGEWEDVCNEFQKMLFVRSLRSDRISFCLTTFVVNNLGSRFVEPPVLDIRAVLDESVAQSPLIFVLSPGVDPTTALLQLAEVTRMSSRFTSLSLGQGQAPIATRMLKTGAKDGNWVFLANCHLSLSWMPKLDKLVETLQTGNVHPEFRLWLSSSPNPDFPISILQAGIKMTTEPPKGLKANLKRLYNLISEEQFAICQAKDKYRKLLFSLCFFHAILLERKKFQQLGWNVVYSFNDSDFEVSENLLAIYLDEYPVTPWDALKYLIAGVNYGGHVTDDWDRRLMLTYINQYFNEDVFNTPFYRLSSLPTYYTPKDGSLKSYRDYITVLPNMDRPEAFGQHPNADITSLISETRAICETLMSLQVQATSSVAESKEDKVMQLAGDVLGKVPLTIDYENTEKLMGLNKMPLDVVLLQEISRYNALLVSMKNSLEDLQKGIQGFVVMSAELEEIFVCIYEGRVPSPWLKAYPSLKLLGTWTRELVQRVEHFANWALTTHPPMLFWLSAYTFPTGFLTAALQTAARTQEIPIDTLGWEYTVFTPEYENTITEPPITGIYVRGTFLEGAGWDKKKAQLIEPQPMQLVCNMPVIYFKPIEQSKKRSKGTYQCPCYYYPIRCGAQGREAYVVDVDLKAGAESSDFWVKRGTALLLSLAN